MLFKLNTLYIYVKSKLLSYFVLNYRLLKIWCLVSHCSQDSIINLVCMKGIPCNCWTSSIECILKFVVGLPTIFMVENWRLPQNSAVNRSFVLMYCLISILRRRIRDTLGKISKWYFCWVYLTLLFLLAETKA